MDEKLNSFERYKKTGSTILSAAGGAGENNKGGNAPKGRLGQDSDIEAAPRLDKKAIEQQREQEEKREQPTEVKTTVSDLQRFAQLLENNPGEVDRLVALHKENAVRAFKRTNAKREDQANLTKPENVRRLNDRFKRAEKLSSLFLFDSKSWNQYSKEDGDYTIRIQTQEVYNELQEAIAELAEHMPSDAVRMEWQRDATQRLEEWRKGKLEWDSSAVLLHLFSDPDEGKRRRELYNLSFGDKDDDNTLYIEDSQPLRANAITTLYNYSQLVTQPMRHFVRVMDLARPLIGADLLTAEQLTELTGNEHVREPEPSPQARRSREVRDVVARILSPFGIMDSYELPLGVVYSDLNAKERLEVAAEITASLAVRNAFITTRSEENMDLITSFLESVAMGEQTTAATPMSQGRFSEFGEDREKRAKTAQQLKDDLDDDRYIMIRQSMLEALSRDSKRGDNKCERPNFCSGVLNGFYREMLDRDENSLGHRTRKDLRRKCNERIEEITRNEVRNNPEFTKEGRDARVYVGEVNFMSQELRRMTDQSINAALETVNETAEQYKKRILDEDEELLEAEENTRTVTTRALEKLRRVAERDGDILDTKSDPEIRSALVESFEVAAEARRTVLAMAVGESSLSSSSSQDTDDDVVMGEASNEEHLNHPTRRVVILFKRKRNEDDNTELNQEEKHDRDSKKRRVDPNASSRSSLQHGSNNTFIPSMAKSKGRMKDNQRVAVKVADPVAVKTRTKKRVTKTLARVTKAAKIIKPDAQTIQEKRAAIQTKRKSTIREKRKSDKGKGKEKEPEPKPNDNGDEMEVADDNEDNAEVTDREALVNSNDWITDGILAGAVIAVATVSAVYVGYNSPWAAATSAMNTFSAVDTSIINAQSGIDQAFKAFDTTANELDTMATILDKIIKDESFDTNNRSELKLIKKAEEETKSAHRRYESLTESAQVAVKRLHVAHMAQTQLKEIAKTFTDLLQGTKTSEEARNVKLDYAIALEYFREKLSETEVFCTRQKQSYAQSLLAVTLLEQTKAFMETPPSDRPQLNPGNASMGTFGNNTLGQQVTEVYQQDLVTNAISGSSALSSVPKLFELKNHQAPIYDASRKPQVTEYVAQNQNTGEATLVYNMKWNDGDNVNFPIRSINIPEKCAPGAASIIALDNTQSIFDYLTSFIDFKIKELRLDGATDSYDMLSKIASGQFEKDFDKIFADSFAKIERDLNDNQAAFEASRKEITALKTLVEETKNSAARRVCTRHIQEMDKNYQESEDACDVLKTHLRKIYREISQRAILEESTHVVDLLYGNVPDWGKIVNPHQAAVKNNNTATPGGQVLKGANVTARHQENATSVSNAFASSWMGDFFGVVHRSTSFLFGDVARVFRRFRVMSAVSHTLPSRGVLDEIIAWSNKPKGIPPEFIQNCSNYYFDPDDSEHDRLFGSITIDKLSRLRTRPLAEALKIDRKFNMPTQDEFNMGLTEKQGQTLLEGIVRRSTCDAALNIVRSAVVKKGDVDYESSKGLKDDSIVMFQRIEEGGHFVSLMLDTGTTIINTYINLVSFLRACSNIIDLVAGVSTMMETVTMDESGKDEPNRNAPIKGSKKKTLNPKNDSYHEPLVIGGVNLNGDCKSEDIKSKINGRAAKSGNSKLIYALSVVKRVLARVIKIVEWPLENGPKLFGKFKDKIARLSQANQALQNEDVDSGWYAEARKYSQKAGHGVLKCLGTLVSWATAVAYKLSPIAKPIIAVALGVGAGYLTYQYLTGSALPSATDVSLWTTALNYGSSLLVGSAATFIMRELAWTGESAFWTITAIVAVYGLGFLTLWGLGALASQASMIASRVAWNYTISKVAPLMIRILVIYVVDQMFIKSKEEETSEKLNPIDKQERLQRMLMRTIIIALLQWGLSNGWSTVYLTYFTPETLGGGISRTTLSTLFSSFGSHFWAGVNGTQTSLITNTKTTIPYAQTLTSDNWRVLNGAFTDESNAMIAQRYSNALSSIGTIYNLMMNRK